MESGKTYKFCGIYYALIDGLIMVKTRLSREWKRSRINDEGYDPEFFSSHVAKQGEVVA